MPFALLSFSSNDQLQKILSLVSGLKTDFNFDTAVFFAPLGCVIIRDRLGFAEANSF